MPAQESAVLRQLPNSWQIDLTLLRSPERTPHLGGNKYHKLIGYLEQARSQGKSHLITMAGAHSNHLRAFAVLCRREGLRATALIRGDELAEPSLHSPEINLALACGVRCIYVARSVYRLLRETTGLAALKMLVPEADFDSAVFVPEGGHGPPGVIGVTDWAGHARGFDEVYIACATGTTCAGFLKGTAQKTRIFGVAVGQNQNSVHETISTLAGEAADRFTLLEDYHCGGFGKTTQELRTIAEDLSQQWQLHVDPVYVGKATLALRERALAGQVAGRALLVYTYNE